MESQPDLMQKRSIILFACCLLGQRRRESPHFEVDLVPLILRRLLTVVLPKLTNPLSNSCSQWGAPRIHVLSVIASKKGLSELLKYHPDVRVTIGAIDEKLSADGDLIPGLGDAGDRLFGTPFVDDDEELVHPSKRKRTLSMNEGC